MLLRNPLQWEVATEELLRMGLLQPLLRCVLWAAIFTGITAQTPNFLAVAPRIIHVGVEESVGVQFEWPSGLSPPAGDIQVNLYLRNQLNMVRCSEQKTVILNRANNYIKTEKLQITFLQATTCKLDTTKVSRYVQLAVESSVLGGKTRAVSIPVSYQRGYLFIQTDKSIYTPKEKVQYRVFCLDHMMRPSNENVILSVFNAQGVQVKRNEQFAANAMIPGSLLIPDISTPGTWKITAQYSTAPGTNFTTEFEVKKYVLPNFEVKIIPDVPYFLISKNELRFRVEARYVYGEPVDGIAYVRVGIIDKDGQKSMLRGLEQQVKLKEGSMDITITKANISEKIKQPLDNLIGTNFYIAASVVEIASGALEEKELTSVKIVASPYILDLSKTKKYYIPSTPVHIVAEVSHADGSPAKGVDVRFTGLNGKVETIKSNDNGVATIHHNLNQDPKSLELTVSAGTSEGSVVETLHLLPYSSATKSFLHMAVPYQVLSPGESVRVTLKVVSAKENDVKKIYYMVLSKGQIISLNYISKSDYIELHIPVTSSMVPSFRIVAYYHLHSEIVANSAWVDVTDECEGKLTLSHKVKDYIEPGLSFNLDVVTDDKAFVSLSVVDTAVYILNSKNKLTLGKMFKAMNLYDLGCSPGGGKDYKNVFMDAGLAFVSKDEYSNLNGFSCKASQRKKRNIEFSVLTQQKVNSYPTRELQRCCGDGMTLLPRKMKRTCVQRAVRIPSQSCKEAFRTCCDYAEKLRLEITLKKRKTSGLGRTQEVGQDDEDDFADENDIQYRTNFPESWYFQTVLVDKKKSIHLNVPDSITTWEIQGIGMSARKGFCIAEPVKLKVFKPFHIHLRVPYSIKRFEQMEIRPVLYNYNDEQLKVRVYMEQTEGICSPAKDSEGSDGIRLTLPANSATAVSFPVVPIGKSNPVITIVALGQNGITDSIRKPLKIVRKGSQVLEEKTYIVDPKDPTRSIITIDDDLPSNLIPDEDFHSSIRMTVDSPLNTINNSLGAEGISNLIRVPSGCAEQTMIRTAPGVYALRYLDHTEKWIMLPPERKDEGMENMKQGYMRILQFRKNDGSYGAWLERRSSTWLTAFVVKVLSLARKYIGVDVEDIRISAKYLTTMQNTDGSFREILSVIHTDMKGGVDGVNAGISLTAYVMIALHHSLESLSENYEEVKKIISKANEYLRNNLDSLSEPYPLAITAYALTLTSVDPTLKDKAFRLLMNIGQEDTKKRELFFGPRNSALAVETTAYALLTALLRKETTTAKMMYTWLTEQQNYGGGFKSTQDTVMALEAMSEYWITTYKEEQTALEVQVQSLERKKDRTFFLRSEDNVQEQLSLGTKFNIKVSGKGKATLTVLKQYNVMQTENSTCNDLGLEVKVSGDDTATKDDNDYNYDYGDDGEGDSADEPRGAIEWHDLRKRARREVSQPKEKEVKVSYEVCIWKKLHAKVSGMAIVDITMLSGFVPNAEDLYKLKNSSERYISHYEIQAGRLLLYFDEVSESKECISFDAIQTVRISLLQPASAILYDFYEPERKCNVFYGAPSKSNFIDTLCSKDVCQCAEGLCPIKQRSMALTENDRQTFACYSPRVVYGYHVRVENIKEEDAFVVYKTKILDVLQKNADENIDKEKMRFFLQRKSCKLRLELKEYLIMGQDGQTKDDKGQIRYLLEDNSWIEELLSPPKCAATRFRNMCLSIKTFMENYKSDGCMV